MVLQDCVSRRLNYVSRLGFRAVRANSGPPGLFRPWSGSGSGLFRLIRALRGYSGHGRVRVPVYPGLYPDRGAPRATGFYWLELVPHRVARAAQRLVLYIIRKVSVFLCVFLCVAISLLIGPEFARRVNNFHPLTRSPLRGLGLLGLLH